MKPKNWFAAAILLCTIVPASAMAQCGTLRTVTYDSTVSGLGTTGGTPFNFSFPQFDGGLGTLMEVQLVSQITLSYKYDIENTLNVNRNHRLRIERYDEVTSPVLASPLNMSYITPWRNHNLSASNGITGSGPDFTSVAPFYIVNNYTMINETHYNTADYIGAGSVAFDYNTYMFRTNDPATGAVINNDASNDAIRFSISYVYCDNIMLGGTRERATREQGAASHNRLFPNPSGNGQFTIHLGEVRSDWKVEILTTSGQLVNRDQFFNTVKAEYKADRRLNKGIYFVRATDLKSGASFIDRLIVR